MNPREKVAKILQEGTGLPAAPAVMARISELCKDPRASARDLGKVLQFDPALTTRVLKQVNSSFYGLSATIKTVTHAVVILGFQEIKHIALSVPVAGIYEDHMDEPGIDIGALWVKTVETACLARALSYHNRHEVPEQVFVSGILANVGMVILNSILGEDYKSVVEACSEEEFLPEVETAELGINHVEVCTMLAQRWHFPHDLVEAVSRNYEPFDGDRVLPEAGLIFCARRLRNAMLEGMTPEESMGVLPDTVTDAFALSPQAITEAWEKAQADAESAKGMVGS
jgi:HD-like signal output (HDOD) protein